MRKSRTVLVVGAGASRELGLPTGYELKKHIRELFDIRFKFGTFEAGDSRFVETVIQHAREHGEDPNVYFLAGRRIRDSIDLAPSIDNFIDAHRNFPFISKMGKLGIFYSLMKAERSSLLYKAMNDDLETIKFSPLENVWLTSFFRILIEANTIESFIDSIQSISIIFFNYDRTIEFFMRQAICQYYSAPFNSAIEIAKFMNIFYPYGNLGALRDYPGRQSSFGPDLFGDELVARSTAIRTFTEQLESDSVESIQDQIDSAEILIFLGFAFHPQNMRLLFSDKPRSVRSIIGTGKGLSSADNKIITRELMQSCSNH